MRSSKQRSRSKNNRNNNRSVGNIVNRVFDSSGPEGKVRGTPQQIIDKYNQLARDSQLSGDRVATENFQQHSEHYTRMLAEAQREQDARREAQEAQQRERQQQQNDQRGQQGGGGDQSHSHQQGQPQQQPQHQQPQPEHPRMEDAPQPEMAATNSAPGGDVMDAGDPAADSGLVETPESKPAPKPRRRTRKPATSPVDAKDAAPKDTGPAEAAE